MKMFSFGKLDKGKKKEKKKLFVRKTVEKLFFFWANKKSKE